MMKLEQILNANFWVELHLIVMVPMELDCLLFSRQ